MSTGTVVSTIPRPQPLALADGLWKMILLKNPTFRREWVVEVAQATLLDQAKAKLRTLGIKTVAGIGEIVLTDHLAINQGGLIAPSTFQAPAVGVHPVVTALSWRFASIPTWPQTESVIVADELDLRDQTITIMRDSVSQLWIIAKTIKASVGAKITYAPLATPAVGVAGIDGALGTPNFNPSARQSTSGARASDGGNGTPGSAGGTGPQGKDAPGLTILALEIDAMPDILLSGQRGGRGGAGGRGGNGGAGERGRDSHVKTALGVPVDCSWGPGYGGNGGAGGDGGPGGQGGRGGTGGNTAIATQQDQLTNLITARTFILDNGGGTGGDPGPQGDPGNGGAAGQAGFRTGWPCSEQPDRHGANGPAGRSTGDRGRGSDGAPGTVGYSVITAAQWEAELVGPLITALEPATGIPGTQVIVHGHNFLNGSTVNIGSRNVPATFNDDQQLNFQLPLDVAGGEQRISVKVPAGDVSNEVPFSVRPVITEARVGGIPVHTVVVGDRVSIMGHAFVSGASLVAPGRTFTTTFVSPSQLDFVVPLFQLDDPGGVITLKVHNPDGVESDSFAIERLPSIDSGFRAAIDGYAFCNFTHGSPTWGDYMDTFGSDEILAESVLDPVLTGAFFAFYEIFLSNFGHCTGFASTSLQDYNQGKNNLFATGPASNADPPPIPSPLMHHIDVAQGRVLSRELIIHYSDQGREGIDRVEKTVHEIEDDFRDGLGESTARVLCFIPSGSVWDIITDETIRNAFINGHCVTPTRIAYPDASRTLDGAKLFVYDNNFPGDDSRFISLFKKNGKIHFSYNGGGGFQPSSENGFTLGTQTLQKQLIDDVDLPFSGGSATAALLTFAAELVLSPARIAVESADGKVLGYKNGKMSSDPALGYVCPWLDNYLLVRSDVSPVRRRIVGVGDGKYTYLNVHPAGRSLTMKDVACSKMTNDSVKINNDFSQVEVETTEEKAMEVHVGEKLPDRAARLITLNFALKKSEPFKLNVAQNLDGIQLSGSPRALDVQIRLQDFARGRAVGDKQIGTKIPANGTLQAAKGMWADLRNLRFTPQ